MPKLYRQAALKDPVIEKFLLSISKEVRLKIKKIYLFGSRARGTERPDSDYDILLVVTSQFTLRDKDHLYDGVMDVLLETGHLISLKIYKQNFFLKLWKMRAPIIWNVKKDGVQLG